MRHIFPATLLLASICLPAFADPQSPQNAPQPQAEHPPATVRVAGPGTVTASFLGVVTRAIDPANAEPLGLPPGTGLEVMQVSPGSPAAAAGLVAGDILARLDDQLLVNEDQLRALIRLHDAGTDVPLTIVRDGQRQVLQATLAQADVVPLGPGGRPAAGGQLMIERPGEWLLMGPEEMELPEDAPAELRMMLEEMAEAMRQAELPPVGEGLRIEIGPGAGGVAVRSQRTVDDGKHRITILQDGETTQLSVHDADGELIYEGPAPEEAADWEILPPDVQVKVRGLLDAPQPIIRLEGEGFLPVPEEDPQPVPEPTREDVF